jgi:hypothetical protein
MAIGAWTFHPDPLIALGMVLAATGVAVVVDAAQRRARRHALRGLSSRLRMTYSSHDHLRVLPKIACQFPVPGAADLCVRDVIYASQGESHRYVFTVEYTTGAVGRKRRHVCVASFCEARDWLCPEPMGPIVLAPAELALVAQYEALASVKKGEV